jgi:hypothetical protein
VLRNYLSSHQDEMKMRDLVSASGRGRQRTLQ